MSEVSRSRTVAAPPAAVWQVLADFGGISEWASNADHSCLLHSPHGEHDRSEVGPGTVRRVQAGRVTLLEGIDSWQEPTQLGYTIDGLPKVVRHCHNQWELRPEGDTATVVTLTTRVDCGPRPPQQLIARLVGRRLAKASDVMLDGLAQHVEEDHHA